MWPEGPRVSGAESGAQSITRRGPVLSLGVCPALKLTAASRARAAGRCQRPLPVGTGFGPPRWQRQEDRARQEGAPRARTPVRQADRRVVTCALPPVGCVPRPPGRAAEAAKPAKPAQAPRPTALWGEVVGCIVWALPCCRITIQSTVFPEVVVMSTVDSIGGPAGGGGGRRGSLGGLGVGAAGQEPCNASGRAGCVTSGRSLDLSGLQVPPLTQGQPGTEGQTG